MYGSIGFPGSRGGPPASGVWEIWVAWISPCHCTQKNTIHNKHSCGFSLSAVPCFESHANIASDKVANCVVVSKSSSGAVQWEEQQKASFLGQLRNTLHSSMA